MAPKTGHEMKLYEDTGTVETPVYEEISAIGDLNISDFSIALGELKHRGSNFVKNLPSLFQSISVDFNLIHGLQKTKFDDLRERFFARTAARFAIMDGDIEVDGSEGLLLPALIKSFPWNQPLEDVSNHDVQLATAYMVDEDDDDAEIDPQWIVVEAAGP